MRYSTATAKGAGSKQQEQPEHMGDTAKPNIHTWIFQQSSGCLEVWTQRFSYYYKLSRERDGNESDEPDPFKVMEECAVRYLQFVKKVHDEFLLPEQGKARTVVLGAEPDGAAPSTLFSSNASNTL